MKLTTFLQSRQINMNVLGDDYVTFAPMHISLSPDGQFLLVSTGEPTELIIILHMYI